MLSIWAGWLLDPDKELLLVLDDDWDVDRILKLLLRAEYSNFARYLAGGMTAWDNAGFPLEDVGQMTLAVAAILIVELIVLDLVVPR